VGNSDTTELWFALPNDYMLVGWGAGRGGGGPGGPTATRLAAHSDDFALSRMEIQENNRHATKLYWGLQFHSVPKLDL